MVAASSTECSLLPCMLPSLLPLAFSAMHMAYQNYSQTIQFIAYCVIINVLAATFPSTGVVISWILVSPAVLFTVVGSVWAAYGASRHQPKKNRQGTWFYGF